MNDDQFFLANAYLDGELTAEERRIAEADPDVMSEVELLRELQAEVRDVPPPDGRAREAAIGAAMAEFAGAAEPATAPVVPYRPRPAYGRYLAIAAAVVTVFGLGVVISQANLGGGDDDDSVALDAAEATAQGTFEALDEAMVADDGGDETADEMVAEEADDVATDAASTEAPMEADAGVESTVEEAAEPAADDDPAAAGNVTTVPAAARVLVPPTFDPDEPVRDETDLGVYGAYLLGLRDDGLLEPTPNTLCFGDYEILDTATLLLDDTTTDVLVAVNEFDGVVLAIDPERCDVLLDASLT